MVLTLGQYAVFAVYFLLLNLAGRDFREGGLLQLNGFEPWDRIASYRWGGPGDSILSLRVRTAVLGFSFCYTVRQPVSTQQQQDQLQMILDDHLRGGYRSID